MQYYHKFVYDVIKYGWFGERRKVIGKIFKFRCNFKIEEIFIKKSLLKKDQSRSSKLLLKCREVFCLRKLYEKEKEKMNKSREKRVKKGEFLWLFFS